MSEPRLTDQAEIDLDGIWQSVAANSPATADRVIDAILAASRLYNRFPNMGQNRAAIRLGLRSFVVSPYVVFYRPADTVIEVLRVLHGARDIDRMIESEN